jgi:NADH dehydrogenase
MRVWGTRIAEFKKIEEAFTALVSNTGAKAVRGSGSRIVIIGGGFAGLACAKVLGAKGLSVTLVDRRNHNLFQPLLYQVATAALSRADIAEPLRKTLGRYEDVAVVLAKSAPSIL